jgi:DNA polymerase-3 subunit gamma/tau
MQAFPGAVIGEIKALAPAVELPAIPDDSSAVSDED